MSWLRLDDDFPAHPKVAALSDREFRVHIRVLCYCARYRTRGEIPGAAYNEIPGLDRKTAGRFLELGLWEDSGDGAHVHDFRRYNADDPTKAERQARWRARKRVDDGNARDSDPEPLADSVVDALNRLQRPSTEPSTETGPSRARPPSRPYIYNQEVNQGQNLARADRAETNRNAGRLSSREAAERYVRNVGYMYEPNSLADDLAERGLDDEQIAELAAIATELREAASASDRGDDSAGKSTSDGG